ncbi:MAG: RNA methyltransferase [Anaerostipes sp.]|nr:RNA methyltransferase [Anaerostipes sp.]MDD3746503.1 RNA methyltransferase [Anaerostipes sp.]
MTNIIEIKDFMAPELDVYARLSEGQLLNRCEPEKGMFIAESPMVIETALKAGCVPVSFLMEKKHINTKGKDIIDKYKDIPVYTAEFDVLTKLTGFQLTRGMLCAMYRPKMLSIEEVCKGADRLVILEDVMNPTNIGAIFRSAAALNMDGILLTSACSNPLYRRSIRVSMGTVFQIPWTFVDEDALDYLKKSGYKTAAMALNDDSICIDDIRLLEEEKLAIILGTEGNGLSDHIIETSDYIVKIPMAHGVDSLNVAAASAVAFWQIGRRK